MVDSKNVAKLHLNCEVLYICLSNIRVCKQTADLERLTVSV